MTQAEMPAKATYADSIQQARSSSMNTVLTVLRTYPYLVPAIFFFVGWQILPIYDALRVSFTDDKFLDTAAPNWIWFQNYNQILHDRLFWKGIVRAFTFTVIFLPGMIFIPMVAAVLIDRVIHNKVATIYRIILLIPSMIPAPLIFVLWTWMYNN